MTRGDHHHYQRLKTLLRNEYYRSFPISKELTLKNTTFSATSSSFLNIFREL